MSIEVGSDKHSKAVWDKLFRSVGAEARETLSIIGASGIEHHIQALGVDSDRGRLIVVAAEPNPRVAALMQADIQAARPGDSVLIARPIAFDLADFARSFIAQFGMVEFDGKKLTEITEGFKTEDRTYPGLQEIWVDMLGPTMLAFQKVRLPTLSQIISIIQQFALLDWRTIEKRLKEDPSNLTVPLNNLIKLGSGLITAGRR